MGTSLPTDLTLTTTMADRIEEEEEDDTDENQNKVRLITVFYPKWDTG